MTRTIEAVFDPKGIRGLNAYEMKRKDRVERLFAAADRAERAAAASFSRAKSATAGIPLGQPILVGHHSEKRHRGALKRADRAGFRGVELMKKARHLRYQANAAASNRAISADDPEAVPKLRAKLEGLETLRATRKAINSAWRKAKKPAADDAEGWTRVEELLAETVDAGAVKAARLDFARQEGYFAKAPYMPYVFQNMGGNIKRVRNRLASLEQLAALPQDERELAAGDGWQLVAVPADNRYRVFTRGKPAAEIRTALKARGWRWAPSAGAWQRHYSTARADSITEQVTTIFGGNNA